MNAGSLVSLASPSSLLCTLKKKKKKTSFFEASRKCVKIHGDFLQED